MTTTTYLIAWIIYLLAAVGLNAIFWKLSHHWKQGLKLMTRISLAVISFTPYFSDPQQYKFAPAFLIVFFELIFGDKKIAANAVAPLLILLLLSIGISLIIQFVRHRPNRA